MPTPVPEIRVDWRNDGLNLVTNDGFETNTTGWSTSAGIAAAATSITRITTDDYVGLASAVVVTTATNGSGVKFDFGTTSFTAGRTYRFRLAAKSVSGTTAAKLIIGSLGTGADRATQTMTLTTAWAVYSVDWTPSGTRTDAEAVFANNAAAIMTARIDHVEVFETIDDITSYADHLTITRGASFDGGSEAAGTCTIQLLNSDGRFSPDNSSSPLTGLLTLGRPVWIRATYSGAVYGMFYGTIRRIVPMPRERLVQIVCEDALYRYGRLETSVELSLDRSIRDFRIAILTDIGESSARYDLAHGVESDIVYTEADQARALDVLEQLNAATGSIHFVRPDPSSSVLYQYTTIDRATIQGQAVDETFNDDLTDMTGYDFTDEGLVNSQRVFATARRVADVPETVWQGDVPFTIDTDTTVWAGRKPRAPIGRTVEDIEFSDPTFDQELTITATGLSGNTFTPFSRSAKIVLTTVTGAEVTELYITGKPARRLSDQSDLYEDLTSVSDRYVGNDISSEFINSLSTARGLASWWVYRYKAGVKRPDATYVNKFPTAILREIGDRVSLTFGLLGVSAQQFLIRSISQEVDMGSAQWTVTYGLESTPTALTLFTVDGTAAQGLGGSGVLGY